MPTIESMIELTNVYEQLAKFAHNELNEYENVRLYTLANLVATLALLVKQLQLEVTNLGQRIEELSDLCNRTRT